MDEKVANTFPFHKLPPELKKISQRSFLFFSPFPYWIKEKYVTTLVIRKNCDKNAKQPKSVLPPYHRTSDYVGDLLKSWVTLELDHL